MAITKTSSDGLANPRQHTKGGTAVTPWVRPADWVTLPTVNSGDQKLVGSYAVFNNASNFVAFTVGTSTSANYTVDWGDGTTPDSVVSTAQINHNYVWANVSSGTLTSDGFRQAIITVTPNSGNLVTINLYKKHTQTNLQNGMTTGWLDIRMASSTLNQLIIGGTTTVKHSLLRQFEYVGTSAQTTSSVALFQNCRELVSVIGTAWTGGITDFTNFFNGCLSLQTIPLLDTHAGLNFTSMFQSCSLLQTIPMLNTAAGTNFTTMFYLCTALQTIPLLNTAAGTNFSSMFLNCTALQTIPLLNTAAGTNFTSMFQTCYALQGIPLLNTAAGITFTSMFNACLALQTIPLLNTAAGITFTSMFTGCSSLQTIPLLNTAAGITFTSMFTGCSSLQTVPLLDTHAGTNFANMFQSCNALQTIPLLNTAAGTTFNSMFSGCSSLQTVPLLVTSAGTIFVSMFSICTALTTIPLLNTAVGTDFSNMFNGCFALQTVPALNLGNGVTLTGMFTSCPSLISSAVTGTKNTISYASCQLSATDLNAIYTNLASGVTAKTITVSANWGNAADDPTIATNKGWTVTGS